VIELKFKDGLSIPVAYPIELKDANGMLVYRGHSNGAFHKYAYDSRKNQTYYENSNGFWAKQVHDERDNQISYEDSNGDWWKAEYVICLETYYEDSHGAIRGTSVHEVVEMTMDEISKAIGKNVKVIK